MAWTDPYETLRHIAEEAGLAAVFASPEMVPRFAALGVPSLNAIIELPCVGMLPPSFVDFALSRRHVDGVMVAGCAEGDCQQRLGNEWTIERMARRRDPYLRQRVDERRLLLSWLPRNALRRRERALADFRAALTELDHE